MKRSAYALTISITAILHGCASSPPFSENDSQSKIELGEYLNGVVTVNDTVSMLKEKGFECSEMSEPWILSNIPKEINKNPTPYLCRLTRETIPLVCSETWIIFIGHNGCSVISTSISHSEPSCL